MTEPANLTDEALEAQLAKPRRKNPQARVAVKETILSLDPEPEESAQPKPAPLTSGEMLCARVRVKDWWCVGLGGFIKGQLIPIDLANAPAIMTEMTRDDRRRDDPTLEILIGRPSPPHERAGVMSAPPTFAKRDRSAIGRNPFTGGAHRTDPLFGLGSLQRSRIKKLTAKLLAEKPSSFFAEKSPREFAIEQVLADEDARIDKERKRHEDALAWCFAQMMKRAERLRREKEELEARAKEAEEQADKLDAITAAMPALSELYALRDRFQRHIDQMSNMCGPKEKREDRTQWGGPAEQYFEITRMIDEGIVASRKDDAAALRVIVDKLDVASEPQLARPLPEVGHGAIGLVG